MGVTQASGRCFFRSAVRTRISEGVFYLSDSYEVAFRMARRAAKQRGGRTCVLVYEVDDAALRKLSNRKFAQPGNRSWTKFVLANRNPRMKTADHNRDNRYDWILGPIVDDGLAF